MLPYPNSRKNMQRFMELVEAHPAQCECCDSKVMLEVPEYGLGLRCPSCKEIYFQLPNPLPALGLMLIFVVIIILNFVNMPDNPPSDPNIGAFELLNHYMPYFWPLTLVAIAGTIYNVSLRSKLNVQLARASKVMGI